MRVSASFRSDVCREHIVSCARLHRRCRRLALNLARRRTPTCLMKVKMRCRCITSDRFIITCSSPFATSWSLTKNCTDCRFRSSAHLQPSPGSRNGKSVSCRRRSPPRRREPSLQACTALPLTAPLRCASGTGVALRGASAAPPPPKMPPRPRRAARRARSAAALRAA